MKKATLSAIVNYLSNNLPYAEENEKDFLQATIDEINAELSKGQAKAEANRAMYADIHDRVIEVLSGVTAPVTAQDLANETKVARGKIVYGLIKLWGDEVIADKSGKTTTYRLA